jgi:hypothetical protein
MLPYHYQTLKNDLQGYNRAIMIHSNLPFGLGLKHDQPEVYMKRLNDFIEATKTSKPFDFYQKYAPDGNHSKRHLKIYNPDLFTRDCNKSGVIHRHMVAPDLISLHSLRKLGDPVYKNHWVASNSYERSIIKLMSDLDESVILARDYYDNKHNNDINDIDEFTNQ